LNGAFTAALGERFRSLLPGRTDEPTLEPVVELIVVDKDGIDAKPDPLVEHPTAAWRVAEARSLAARVRALIDLGEACAGDIVVLLRATTDMHVYEQALERERVPTYVIGGRGYWSHPQVIELVGYLRALANPLDTEALYSVLLSPLCGLSLDGLVLYAAGAPDELCEEDRAHLAAFDFWFEQERRAAAWLGAEQLLDRALAHSGYELHIAGLPDARRRLANVRKLMRLAREWRGGHGSDLRGFVNLLQTRAGGGDRESEAPVEGEALDAVRLMTIHRSKGLEFPVVCVADLGRQVVPRVGALVKVGRDGESLGLRLRRPGFAERVNVLAYEQVKAEERELELAEERRLFYVAMTRAKERLIVSGAAKLGAWEEGNRLAPIGWVGTAFVPDIATRASAALAAVAAAPAAAPAVGGTTSPLPPFITDLGVRVSFVTRTEQPDPVDVIPLHAGKRQQLPAPTASPMPDPGFRPAIPTLSYTALSTYEQCGYRFYVQRVLGLADAPTPAPTPQAPTAPPAPAPEPPAPTRPTLSGADRGTLIHQLLASLDLRRPSLVDPMPADVRDLLTGLLASSTFARLTAMHDVRREQRFAFPIGETLITGVFDVLARERERDRLLVVDYKSDRLAGSDPQAIVAERYTAQRTIYALAALKLGAASVEVAHLFLEAAEDPVSATFTAADAPTLEADLALRVAGVGGSRSGDFPVTNAPGRRVCDGCPAQGGLCSHPLAVTTR
jgi:ATP-dependent helicase/nuclease subunit A